MIFSFLHHYYQDNIMIQVSCVFFTKYDVTSPPPSFPPIFLSTFCNMIFIDLLIWVQEDRISETGKEAEIRESTLFAHTCFLIKSMSQREEHIRDITVNLLTQLRDKFPQVEFFWQYCWLFINLFLYIILVYLKQLFCIYAGLVEFFLLWLPAIFCSKWLISCCC